MKRSICVFLVLICLTLSSCTESEYKILPFEDKTVRAECTVNDSFDVIIYKDKDSCSLEVIAPSELYGLKFLFSDSGSYAASGELKIPVSRDDLNGIYALSSLFNISEDMMVSASSKDGRGYVGFSRDDAEYTFIFDNDGFIEGAVISSDQYEYKIRIRAMEIK